MQKKVQLISAPSILGLRPSGVEHLADALLSHGLHAAVGSMEPIISVPTLNHQYQPVRATPSAVLNEQALAEFSSTNGRVVSTVISDGRFPLVLGGDCSILLE